MADKSAWLITIGDGADALAQLVAAELRRYGLTAKGQRWPLGEKQAWLASALEAADANTGIVVIISSAELFHSPVIQRSLSLFRLHLQTRLNRNIDGFVVLFGEDDANTVKTDDSPSNSFSFLKDWQLVSNEKWAAKAVARLHAPSKSSLPYQFRIYAEERLGVWLEIHPHGEGLTPGFLLGVSGNDAKILFHAVGEAGRLPERSVNEYEMKGIKFDSAGHAFEAWGLQNSLTKDQSYFVKIEGEPNVIALGTLPNGELSEVDLIYLIENS